MTIHSFILASKLHLDSDSSVLAEDEDDDDDDGCSSVKTMWIKLYEMMDTSVHFARIARWVTRTNPLEDYASTDLPRFGFRAAAQQEDDEDDYDERTRKGIMMDHGRLDE
jgi:hypothetical protein